MAYLLFIYLAGAQQLQSIGPFEDQASCTVTQQQLSHAFKKATSACIGVPKGK